MAPSVGTRLSSIFLDVNTMFFRLFLMSFFEECTRQVEIVHTLIHFLSVAACFSLPLPLVHSYVCQLVFFLQHLLATLSSLSPFFVSEHPLLDFRTWCRLSHKFHHPQRRGQPPALRLCPLHGPPKMAAAALQHDDQPLRFLYLQHGGCGANGSLGVCSHVLWFVH